MKSVGWLVSAIWAIGALVTSASGAAFAQAAICAAPAMPAAEPGKLAPLTRVRDYQVTLRQCRNGAGAARVAIRRMAIGDGKYLLAVDPSSLATSLEHEECWVCSETTPTALKNTRYMRALAAAATAAGKPGGFSPYLRNAGLGHGEGEGSFVTGDLCPTTHRFDRVFFEMLETIGARPPVALAVTGGWMTRHVADFQWLQERARAGALEITWVNHSFHHPYFIGRPNEANFLLSPGVDMNVEIFDLERLLIANGETPSVFFRFPGLISSPELMETVRQAHLVALGTDAWLALNPQTRPGSIVLVHPNGNEPDGLRHFARLLDGGKLPLPLRRINEAPTGSAPQALIPPPEAPLPPLRGTLDEACAERGGCAKSENQGEE